MVVVLAVAVAVAVGGARGGAAAVVAESLVGGVGGGGGHCSEGFVGRVCVFALLGAPFFFGGENAFLGNIRRCGHSGESRGILFTYMLCKALPTEPPPHGLGTDVDRSKLEHPVP